LTVWDVLAYRARFPRSDGPVRPTGLADRTSISEQHSPAIGHLRLQLLQLVEPFIAQ
jgi:hypothetical protein